MLKNFIQRIFPATLILVALAVSLATAQGIQSNEYSGLDKYIGQGRADNSSFVGTRAAEFLTIPVGARAIAMGSAYTAIADDISAIWWNPAGIGFLESTEMMFTVVDYTLDFTYSYLAGATPIGDGRVVLGGFFGYMDYPQIEMTTISSPNGTGSFFSAYDFQMGGSIAYHLSDRFVAGLNVKYVHQDVYNNLGANAFALDAGGIYHTEFMDREIKFAFAIQNLGSNMTMRGPLLNIAVGPESLNGGIPDGYGNYSDDLYAISRRSTRSASYNTHTYRLPTAVKMAMSYSLYTGENANWLASGELWRNSNIPMSYSVGTEVTYNFTTFLSASLRTGWKIQSDEFTEDTDEFGYSYLGDDPTYRGFSFGGGIKRQWAGKFVEFSYAYRNKGRLSADNFFTMSIGF